MRRQLNLQLLVFAGLQIAYALCDHDLQPGTVLIMAAISVAMGIASGLLFGAVERHYRHKRWADLERGYDAEEARLNAVADATAYN